jgi:HEAT repeat protein
MLVFCTRCWSEMSDMDSRCPQCGTVPSDDPRVFKEKLTDALNHPLPATRARICWVLGHLQQHWTTTHLLRMLADPDLYVRIAAIEALGSNGDLRAASALERIANSETLLLRKVARTARMRLLDQEQLKSRTKG